VWKHARTINFQALQLINAVFEQAHESPVTRQKRNQRRWSRQLIWKHLVVS
jgi:hypothetical protein